MEYATPEAVKRTHSFTQLLGDIEAEKTRKEREKAGLPAAEPEVDRIVPIEVYICPTPGCPDYYGAGGMPALEGYATGPKTEDRHQVSVEESRVEQAGKRHSRAECPTCRSNGVYVDRVRTTAYAILLKSAPAA